MQEPTCTRDRSVAHYQDIAFLAADGRHDNLGCQISRLPIRPACWASCGS